MTRNGVTLPGPHPRLLVAVRAMQHQHIPQGAGLLYHDLPLDDLIRISAAADAPMAADVDSIEGLAQDEAAITFLAGRLRIGIVITKRPALALRAADLGCIALLHVHCLDSTGLDRALGAHPGPPVGTAVSPGLILAHLSSGELQRLPGPVLAYGLIRRRDEARAALNSGAEGVVMESPGTLDSRAGRAI